MGLFNKFNDREAVYAQRRVCFHLTSPQPISGSILQNAFSYRDVSVDTDRYLRLRLRGSSKSASEKENMLKACWDCLAGEQRQGNEHYSVQLNGGSSVPPWPVSNSQTGKMFAVPRNLRVNDEIIIKGAMADGMLDIALRPNGDQSNIVSQINVVYPDNQPHNQIILRSVVNGNENSGGQFTATDYFYDMSFDVRFIITSRGIRISIGEEYLETVPLEHSEEDIRYISVRGEVKEMIFRFNAYG